MSTADDENWTGGSYELCLALGPADDGNLDRWSRRLRAAAPSGPVLLGQMVG
jgi:hypothetical protein